MCVDDTTRHWIYEERMERFRQTYWLVITSFSSILSLTRVVLSSVLWSHRLFLHSFVRCVVYLFIHWQTLRKNKTEENICTSIRLLHKLLSLLSHDSCCIQYTIFSHSSLLSLCFFFVVVVVYAPSFVRSHTYTCTSIGNECTKEDFHSYSQSVASTETHSLTHTHTHTHRIH